MGAAQLDQVMVSVLYQHDHVAEYSLLLNLSQKVIIPVRMCLEAQTMEAVLLLVNNLELLCLIIIFRLLERLRLLFEFIF